MPFESSQYESQRDSAPKPGVATKELPWAKPPMTTNPNGVEAFPCLSAILNFRKALGLAMKKFQHLLVGAAAWISSGHYPARAEAVATVKMQVDPNTVISRISPDFLGLGYETSAVAQTNYFSANDATLIQLYRNLGTHGLIRIGGNISDHTRYEPDGISVAHTEREVTIINRANLADLAGFVRATGWRVMWGLNLGTGSPEAAAQEAVAVDQALGQQLQSFEIGNEVDLRGGYQLKFPDFNSYYSNYLAFKAAIRMALPAAAFSGPDVAGNLAWLQAFARQEGQGIHLLTHHYYRTGAKTPGATFESLLNPDPDWQARLGQLQTISQDCGVPFRINEVNSFYGGGKPGVSDTFVSALWCLNNLFVLASHGCTGVNMETDINQLGFISHYSPVVHDPRMTCHARPEYYGLLAFAITGQGSLLESSLDKPDLNVNAYATQAGQGVIWITAINEDLSRDAGLEVALPARYLRAQVFRLVAPSVASTNQVRLAGAEVSGNGHWASGSPEQVPVTAGTARVIVPHVSAVLLRLQR